jgi:hypothetical protein
MHRSILCVLPLLGACYTYAPLELSVARPGMDVRARVTAAAADRVAPLLGTADARLLTGRVIQSAPDTVIVEVPTVVRAAIGSSFQTLRQRVSIPRADLLELETRKLDRIRTGAVAGSAAVIVGAVAIKVIRGDRGREPYPGGGGGPERVIPLWRIQR